MKIADVPEEGRRFVTLFTIAQKVGNCSRKERNAETIKKEKRKKEKKTKCGRSSTSFPFRLLTVPCQ